MNFRLVRNIIAINNRHVANCEARLAHAEAHDAPASQLEMFRANLDRAIEARELQRNTKLSEMA